MKTQISREGFTPTQRYSGVYQQQGRMITDADWNESEEIAKARLDEVSRDAIGTGVPRERGLRIEAVAGQPLRLRAGRIYAEGLGGLATSTLADPTTAFGLNQQADLPLPAGVVPPAVSYRLYADLWERSLVSLEDPTRLRDAALHGADTATRTQTMAQLKWCASAVNPEDPAVNPPQGNARLGLTLRQQLAGLDPCDPCAAEIAVPPRVGNFLFRVEVHGVEGAPGNPDRLVLKWSSENGAEAHAVGSEPADFKGVDWVYEHFSTTSEKHLGVHLSGGIAPVSGTLSEGFPAAPPAGLPFVRRWDGYARLRRNGNVWTLEDGRERGVDLSTTSAADADGHVSIGGGALTIRLSMLTLALELANRAFVAGDYWTAPVREAVHAPGTIVLQNALPRGVRHRYFLLATIDATGAAVAPDTNRAQRLDVPALSTLAARDVDYTPSCPSGLFTAAHDTVQKALDQVCGINATHVGFTKPCDTSVYKGIDPAAINTVAKALALLCDVKAEQISYKNDPACTTLVGATTVQQALDLLCVRSSSGGCATTVGRGGEFPDLRTAIEAKLALDERDLCFCLLPGDHEFRGPFTLDGANRPLRFHLHGCGAASRLAFTEGPFVLQAVAAVHLAEVACTLDADSPWVILGGQHVELEGVQIAAIRQQPLRLGASAGVRVARCEIEVQANEENRLLVRLFEPDPDLAKLFDPRRNDKVFLRASQIEARRLAAMPLRERTVLANKLKAQGAGELARALTGEAREIFNEVVALIGGRAQPKEAELVAGFRRLREIIFAVETFALVLDEGSTGDFTMLDNRISGSVSLHGSPGRTDLTVDHLARLRGGLASGAIQLAASAPTLLIERNSFSQLEVGGELILALRDLSLTNPPAGTARGFFRTARLTNNTLSSTNNRLICEQATLSGNLLTLGPRGEPILTVIAEAAFYLGNHGLGAGNSVVRNIAPRTNGATRQDLNGVNIVDV